jgi:serine/threonine protein kinase
VSDDDHSSGTRLKPVDGTRLKAADPHEHTGTGTRLRSPDQATTGPTVDPRARADSAPSSHEPWTSQAERRLQPGTLIKNRFLLQEQIGQGGMGLVFKARDQEYEGHEQYVAIKFLSGELQGRPEALRALEQEVRKTHELAHPNIVTVYDFYRDAPYSFISMEFLDGEPLDQLLRRKTVHGLPFSAAWPIIEGAGTALAYAHQHGIIHSDFKPGNVFITRNERVKVLDFGIARAARMDSEEFDVTVLGGLTPAYASPEMVLNLEPDPRDDVYALACVAYELLSGQHPFGRTPAHRAQHAGMAVPKVRGLTRARMRALQRGLAFTRDARTPSVLEFLNELEATSRRARMVRWASAAAVSAVAILGGSGYLYSSLQRCPNLDAEFLRSLQAGGTAQTLDASYREVLVEQGQEYLAMAEEEFNASLLSEGVSDAFGAFSNALRIDPDNPTVLAGIMRIFELYEAEAERLYELGAAQESVAVADYGLRVHPLHCGLNSIKERASALLD